MTQELLLRNSNGWTRFPYALETASICWVPRWHRHLFEINLRMFIMPHGNCRKVRISNELPHSIRLDLMKPRLEFLSGCTGVFVNINKGLAINSPFNQETMFLLLPFTLSIRRSLSYNKHWDKKALALSTVPGCFLSRVRPLQRETLPRLICLLFYFVTRVPVQSFKNPDATWRPR